MAGNLASLLPQAQTVDKYFSFFATDSYAGKKITALAPLSPRLTLSAARKIGEYLGSNTNMLC